ncbi:MAG: hypothetical protein RL328_1180 [Acidobacteriota bacterium]|jgi:putative FmdB family regulatory protein
MPLYDYHCSKCDTTFEVRQKFDDPLLTEHEGCGGKVERLIATPALQFKGSGFYITDYKGGSNPANSGKTESSGSTTASSSSETKPASTTTKSE